VGKSTEGVLLLGFGGPDSVEEIGPFMCELMGREPSEELLARVRKRYLTIGGKSPLPEIAAEIASALETELGKRGHAVPVRVGMRYWSPFIGQTLREMYDSGVRRVVTVSLSPFESAVSSGAYRDAVTEALAGLPGMEAVESRTYHDAPDFIGLLAGASADALERLGEDYREHVLVVFTAHSLPLSDIAEDGTYVVQLEATALATAIALKLGPATAFRGGEALPGIEAFGDLSTGRPWLLAYQSKGQKPGEWLGPDVEEVIAAAAAQGLTAVAICPIGFVTDHMETLYDLDVVAAGAALDAGLESVRATVPNAHPDMIRVFAEAVASLLSPSGEGRPG